MERFNKWMTLIANMAMVLSIVFLGIEIHQNTNVARANTYRELTQDIASWRTTLASHPKMMDAYLNRRDGHADQTTNESLGLLDNNIMADYENAYFSWRLGIIDESQWQRFKAGACIHWTVQDRMGLKSPYLSAEFQAYMVKTCPRTRGLHPGQRKKPTQ